MALKKGTESIQMKQTSKKKSKAAAPIVGTTENIGQNIDEVLTLLDWFPEVRHLEHQLLGIDWKDVIIERLWREYEHDAMMSMVDDEGDFTSILGGEEVEEYDPQMTGPGVAVQLILRSPRGRQSGSIQRFLRSLEKLIAQAEQDLQSEELIEGSGK